MTADTRNRGEEERRRGTAEPSLGVRPCRAGPQRKRLRQATRCNQAENYPDFNDCRSMSFLLIFPVALFGKLGTMHTTRGYLYNATRFLR
jgi:hypothetical protein